MRNGAMIEDCVTMYVSPNTVSTKWISLSINA
jgi:hypothetical protein